MGIPLIKKKPIISVIITAYNRDQYLEQCVNSVLNQTIPKNFYEIIIIKNFESPVDILSETENVIILHSDIRELGPKLYTALERSSGDIIAFIEDDDLWEPNKLETVLEKFQKNTELGFYHNAYAIIDRNGHPVDSLSSYRDAKSIELHDIFLWKQGDSFRKLNRIRRGRGFFNMSCISIRREAILKYNLELQELSFSPDFFVFFSALCSGMEIMADPSSLTLYRISGLNSHFVSTPTVATNQKIDWQVRDRQVLLEMSERFGSRSAISMAKFELADFLTIRLIRQFMRNHDGTRQDIVNLFRNNRYLAVTLLFQSRYLYKNIGMLVILFMSPRIARLLRNHRTKKIVTKD